MGTCYSVMAKLKFKNGDPTEFCKIMKREFAERDLRFRESNVEGEPEGTPMWYFKALTEKDVYEDEKGWLQAGFDASYGWGNTILEVFEAAAHGLANGSRIKILGWDWDPCTWTTIAVKNGEVVITG